MVFALGLMQSSPLLTQESNTVKPSTLYVSHPSLFLGRFLFVLVAEIETCLKTTFLDVTIKLCQTGELIMLIPETSRFVQF